MFSSSPESKEQSTWHCRWMIVPLLLLICCGYLSCSTAIQESKPTIKYDEKGRIKGLFGLRLHPSGDPTCRLEEFTVDFVNIERNEYLVFSLPTTFYVWVKVEGEMQKIFSDPQNTKAREFLSKQRKYKLTTYACDAIGHTSYEPVSVEVLE